MQLAPSLLLPFLAQTPAAPAFPGAAIDGHVRAGRYLAALDQAEHEAGVEPGPMLLDMLGLVQSYVGLEEETQATFDAMNGEKRAPVSSSPIDQATALDAIPAIVEASRGRRIVILNESHHMPRHRAFALELARALRAQGFDTFAAETFTNSDETTKRGYPAQDTGYYTVEPVFGELVRGVLALGYRTVAYEMEVHSRDSDQDPRARINDRENQQAQNLVARVFAPHPEARLFVYVGYSHATENWFDPGGPNEQAWMAARLADLTGFDPLTIDQTTAMPCSGPDFENPHWRRAEERGLLDGPRVLRLADRSFFVAGDYAGKLDLQVFHPRTKLVHGRPDWLARGRTPVPVPAELAANLPEDERALLQAFRAGEGPDAIPTDQFIVQGRASLPSFLLPPGEYRLVLQDVGGKARATHEGVRVD